MNGKEIVCLAAQFADEKKAENIKVIDLGGLSSLCDYVLIATVTSKPHLDAVEEEISMQLKQHGIYKTNRDGGESMQWRVSDYGAFLVHLMTQPARDFYALEKIFSFGKEINFKAPAKPAQKVAAKKPAPKKEAAKPAKKVTVKKAAPKATAAKKPAIKKAVVKKVAVKKIAAKKVTVKKAAAKKPAVKKAPAKKTTVKKGTVKAKVSVKKPTKKVTKK